MVDVLYRRSPDGRANRAALVDALAAPGEVLLTVHGTFAGDPSNDGANWWQRGSAFIARVGRDMAAKTGAPPTVLPFHWSGENSDFERLRAARRLAAVMRKLEKAKRPYHILAHSHGGNVVVEAINRFTRIGRKRNHLRSVVTFGTPYFRRALKPLSRAFLLYRACLLVAFMLGSLGAAILGPVGAVMALGSQLPIPVKLILATLSLLGAALVIVPTIFLWRSVIPPVREGRRFVKCCDKDKLADRWLALFARRDEAIGLLTRAAVFEARFISSRGMARSLGRLSSFIAGMAIALVPIAVLIFRPELYGAGAQIVEDAEARAGGFYNDARAALLAAIGTQIGAAFLYALPMFAVIHFTLSLLFRMGPHHATAWFMNRTIVNGLRTGVFGDDAHYSLTGVSATPDKITVKSREFESAGLGGISEEAAVTAAQAVYSELIELKPDGELAADPAGVWSRLSGSIYHNAYFTDDDVMDATVSHLSECVSGACAPAAPSPPHGANGVGTRTNGATLDDAAVEDRPTVLA